MPAHAKTMKELQAEAGPDFTVVPGNPHRLICNPCGTQAFEARSLKQHISSAKHQRNTRPSDEDNRMSTGSSASSSSAALWVDDSCMLPDDPEAVAERDFFARMEVDDDTAQLLEEFDEAELMAGHDEAALALTQERSYLALTHGGDAWPFPSRETFIALAHKSSPTHALCQKAMQSVRDAVGQTMYCHKTADAKIFWAGRIQDKLKDDFLNPIVRPQMMLMPRRGEVVEQHYDGTQLAFPSRSSASPPSFRRQKDKQSLFVDEVVRLPDDRLVRIHAFFMAELEDGRSAVRAEGRQITEEGRIRRFQVHDNKIEFDPEAVDLADAEELRRVRAYDNFGQPLVTTNSLRSKAAGRLIYRCPVIIFADETSGSPSKRWNEHTVIYMSNAALSRKNMDMRGNVKLLAVSPEVGVSAMLDVFVAELIKLYSEPLPVWDMYTDEEILVQPMLAFCVADNPMAAALTGSIGMRGLYACRECKAGGTKVELKTPRGFEQLLKIGERKTSASVSTESHEQLTTATEGVLSKLKERQKKSGVKDEVTHKFCEELLSLYKDSPAEQRDQALASRKAAILEGKWQCPLFDLAVIGFDACSGVPVDILHTFQLGLVKYVWNHTVSSSTNQQRIQIAARISDAPLSGIMNATSLPGSFFVNRPGTLNGKDLKHILQVAALAFYPLLDTGDMDLSLWCCWSALGILGRLLYVESIPTQDMAQYKEDLRSALLTFYGTAAAVMPQQMIAKPKYHIMLHAIEHIDKYGPAKSFSSERYESFNAVIRRASIFSNRSAASKDILQHLLDQELVRHLTMGGGWMKDGQFMRPSPQLRSMLPKGICEDLGVSPPPPPDTSCSKYIVSEHGDRIKIGEFAVVRVEVEREGEEGVNEVPSVVRLNSISTEEDGRIAYGFTAMEMEENVTGLEPVVLKESHELVGYSVAGIELLINVAHHCRHHGCLVEQDARAVRMERQTTEHRIAGVVHRTDGPQQYLLNHSCFRSGLLLKDVYPALNEPPSEEEIADQAMGEAGEEWLEQAMMGTRDGALEQDNEADDGM
ncbi:hypothetical protein OC844_005337, partial [Tilletia horrida]